MPKFLLSLCEKEKNLCVEIEKVQFLQKHSRASRRRKTLYEYINGLVWLIERSA